MDRLLVPGGRQARAFVIALLDLVEQQRPMRCRGGRLDLASVAGERDACVLRARNFGGRVFGQLGDHCVRVSIGSVVQTAHQFRHTQMRCVHVSLSFHRHRPNSYVNSASIYR